MQQAKRVEKLACACGTPIILFFRLGTSVFAELERGMRVKLG